jgi:hypothetical protein
VPSTISFCGLYMFFSPSIINTSITICSRSIDTRRWHDGSHFDDTGETNSTSGSCIIEGACANVSRHKCHQCVWLFNRPYDIFVVASRGPTPSALSTRPSWRSSRFPFTVPPRPATVCTPNGATRLVVEWDAGWSDRRPLLIRREGRGTTHRPQPMLPPTKMSGCAASTHSS